MLTELQQQLVTENMKLVHFIANKWTSSVRYIDSDEIFSICSLGLVKAAKYYKPEKSKFATFAVPCMNNEVLQVIRKYKNKQILDVSFETNLTNKNGTEYNYHDLIDSEDISFWNAFESEILSEVEKLRDRDKLIFKKINLEGEIHQDIANKLGISQSYVTRINKRVKQKIKSRMSM